MHESRGTREANFYFAFAALLAVVAAAIVWRLADGPDSDFVVGLITAAPAAVAAFGLALAGHLRQRRTRER